MCSNINDIDIFDYISHSEYEQFVDECIQNNLNIEDELDKLRKKIYDYSEMKSKKSSEKTKEEKIKTSRTTSFLKNTSFKTVETKDINISAYISRNVDYDSNEQIKNFDRYIDALKRSNTYARYVEDNNAVLTYDKLFNIMNYLIEQNPKRDIVEILAFLNDFFDIDIQLFKKNYLTSKIITKMKNYARMHGIQIRDDEDEEEQNVLL